MPANTKTSQFRGFVTESNMRVPKYKPTVPVKPEMEDEMYPEKWPPYTHNDVEKRMHNILEPLSLFAPYPHEDHKEAPVEDEKSTMELERPVTPIDEEIKVQPKDLDKLANYVRRRIAAKPDVPYLDLDDQRNLAGILIGEITLIWPEIKQQIDDPFLTPAENKELNRRIAVHIVTVCEKLFHHFLKKAQVLNERGIFSGPANMSRLKAQLALEAKKFLNILTIRRYIVADIRGKEESETEDDMFDSKPVEVSHPPLSFKGMIESSRPKSRVKKFRYKSAEQEYREITQAMPVLDTNKLIGLVSSLPDRDLATPSQESPHATRSSGRESRSSTSINTEEQIAEGLSKEMLSTHRILFKKSPSMPNLQVGESIVEDIGIDIKKLKKDLLSDLEEKILKREINNIEKFKNATEKDQGPKPGTWEYMNNDLKQLAARPSAKEETKIEEDLPPLLQALTKSAKHDGMKEKIEQKIKELEEKERLEDEKMSVPLRQPTHPQPSTVSANYKGLAVRASDIRASNRVCMSSITIDRFSTVYNDLMDEIDPVTVKNLDKNLFLGEEITEVYREIMKTVPKNHLKLDDDSMVMPAAESVNLVGTMASSTLTKKPSERVINPRLRKEKTPPWGQEDPKIWVRTPNNPPKNFLGDDIFQPTTPNMETVHDALHNPTKMSKMCSGENMPKFVAEKMARTYASWLQWWKSTLSTDDYMKYLSTTCIQLTRASDKCHSNVSSASAGKNFLTVPTQALSGTDLKHVAKNVESDYMGVAFHFYDSDDEDEDEDEVSPMYSQSLLGQPLLHIGASKVLKPHSSKLSELKRSRAISNKRKTRLENLADKPSKVIIITPDQGEREKKLNELKEEKNKFETGYWNVNTIMMGGLGKDPKLHEDLEDDASSKRMKSADTTKSAKTLQERAAARHSAKMQEKNSGRDFIVSRQSRQSKVTSVTGTVSKLDTDRSDESGAVETPLSPQDRLEKVWKSLEMPDSLKLDMAIKYSCNEFYSKLFEAIDKWEKVTELILKREELLGKLERFERMASDPNRFFVKGTKRSSVKRLEEAKNRSYYYKRIEYYDREIKTELEYMKKSFRDIITFKGRAYEEKMKWDRIEMLYWLQEERKQNAMTYEQMMKNVPMKMKKAHLDPIPSTLQTAQSTENVA